MSPVAAPILLDDSRQAEEELPALYAAQGLRVQVPVLIAALLIAWLAADHAPRWLLIGWVSAVAVVPLLRVWVNQAAARAQHIPILKRMNAIAVASALGGIVHGQSVMLWPYMNELERTVQSTFMLGLCAAAVATVYGYMRVYVAYLVPMLGQLSFGWVRALAGPDGSWFNGASGVMLLMVMLFGAVMVVLARGTFRLFSESFESRQRLRRALENAEAANRAKTRFLASASHDLRQPMHTLSLFSAALTMRPLDAATREITTNMNLAMQALSTQLDALLDISKLDAGVVPVRQHSFALSLLLDRLREEFAPLAGRKGLGLLVHAPLVSMCHTDPLLLERVLRNLLDNAIKYSVTGSIILSAERRGSRLQLSLQDSGCGIPESEHERVFEEFYQLGNPERDRAQGLGLGLSIVRRLADLLQLALTMRSAPMRGTTFTLQIAASDAPAEPATPTGDALPSIRGLRVLVVDDEEAVRDGMRAVLEALGSEVQLATGSDQAEQLARDQRPDVVLADFRLQGTDDGLAAIRRLRAIHPGLAAVLVSGDTAPARLREAHAAGLRLLHKPASVKALTNAIREEVDRQEETPDAT